VPVGGGRKDDEYTIYRCALALRVATWSCCSGRGSTVVRLEGVDRIPIPGQPCFRAQLPTAVPGPGPKQRLAHVSASHGFALAQTSRPTDPMTESKPLSLTPKP